jgi:hypothetical protein
MAVLATAVISGRIHSPTARVFCMADVTALMAVVREGAAEAAGSAKDCSEKGRIKDEGLTPGIFCVALPS